MIILLTIYSTESAKLADMINRDTNGFIPKPKKTSFNVSYPKIGSGIINRNLLFSLLIDFYFLLKSF